MRTALLTCLLGAATWGCGHPVGEATAASGSGGSSGGGSVDAGCGPYGLPVITAGDSQAVVTSNGDGSIVAATFGMVTTRLVETLELSNRGCASLTILSVAATSADEAEFSIDLVPGLQIAPGQPPVPLPVHLVPFTTGPKTAQIILTTDSAAVPTVTLTLSGMAIKLSVALVPQQIDFGNVVIGTTATQSLSVTNNSGIGVSVTVGQLKGTSPSMFAAAPAPGSVLDLADGETREVTIAFSPTEASPTQFQAYFSMKLCSSGTGCEPLVSLRGTGVATGWAIDPSTLDWGFVPPGRSVRRFFTVSNVANYGTITLTADPLVLNDNADGTRTVAGAFALAPGYPTKGTVTQSLQIGITFDLPVGAPERFYTGELDLSINDPSGAYGIAVPLKAGPIGGAEISCAPTSLDFGTGTKTLFVLCTNVGQDVPGHPEAALFIPDPNSTNPPLAILNGDAAFEANFDQAFFPTVGLAAGESIEIAVTYQPTSSNPDADTLLIHSNDWANPTTKIPLHGSGL